MYYWNILKIPGTFEFNCFLAIKFKEIEILFVKFDTAAYC